MLDDLKYIHEKDAQDALGLAAKQSQQLTHDFVIAGHDQAGPIEQVVFAGMGGSALAAQISMSWPDYKVPFEIVREYDIPAYVDNKTLFIASSYSGNTEETISALEQAEQKGAQIVVITSGGKLAEIAEQKNYPIAKLPSGFQPRFATLYNLKALVTFLDAYGVGEGLADSLASKAGFVDQITQNWTVEKPTTDNLAKKIALDVVGKSPVIYAGPKMFPAAYKWKISFNENAKNIAWCNQLPEFNHNEFLGWTSHPVDKPYAVIDLRSSLEHERINKRFAITEKLLSGKRPHPITVNAHGEDVLEHLLYLIIFGDFVSLYTALLNGLNPSPVEIIEKLKTELKDA